MSGGAGRAGGRQCPRDEFGRFAPRVYQAIVGGIVETLNPSNLVQRNGSRVDDCVGEPGGLSGWEDRTRVITRESNLGQHQASISEEETLTWVDGEDSSDSEDSEEGVEWDFCAFRRRSSVASARLLRGRLARNSVVAAAVAPLNTVGMAAQIKFQTPPTSTGRDGEDVVSWIHRYEKVGRYNRWGENELRDHIELSLEGAAGKWYACMEATGNLPNAWSDVQGPPMVRGVKSTLLTQFTPVNYVQHNEVKLRARKQGIEESTLEYYYDVLDLCRRPTNCDEFLQEVKRFQEMTDRGKQYEWALGVMGREERPTYDPSQQDATVETRLGKIERMLGVMGREEKPTYDPSQQDATVETRLEKIERMLEELMQRRKRAA
ncbi:hypothetical protein OUZ56_016299 [Daphnia magna]|uniref:Retrotransposon gag domain-containing protein n=1 Tax=Daphnia magna TaxID=35525 RepID=A0ABR0AQ99_9CRUS|nr:hypothetical protein OUZ56_016299 [Daphnia magna]